MALAGALSIGLGDLPPEISGLAGGTAPALLSLPREGCQLDDVMNEVERRLLLEALDRTGGVRKTAAKLLGITFRSLRYRLQKHALEVDGAPESDEDDERPSDRVE